MAHGQGADRARTDPYKGNLGLPGREGLVPVRHYAPPREGEKRAGQRTALEGWTGIEPVATALQAAALPLSYHPICPASAGREKRKERKPLPGKGRPGGGTGRIRTSDTLYSASGAPEAGTDALPLSYCPMLPGFPGGHWPLRCVFAAVRR